MIAGGDPHRALIQQVVFGWVKRGSGHEMGVYVSSYPDRSVWPEVWWERLGHYVRLKPSQTDNGPVLPDTALSYLTFSDGLAALLRRTSSGIPGRNWSHALVGWQDDIERFALTIDAWPHWLDLSNIRHLAPISPHELAATLRTAAVEPPDLPVDGWVRTVQDQLDREPYRRITVVGLDPRYALPVLYRLTDPRHGGPYRGSFSTYEVKDTDESPDDPAIMFVPAVPAAGTTERVRVFPLESVPEPDFDDEWQTEPIPVDDRFEPAVPAAPTFDEQPRPAPIPAAPRPRSVDRGHVATAKARRKLSPAAIVVLIGVFVAGLVLGQLLAGPTIHVVGPTFRVVGPAPSPVTGPAAPPAMCVVPRHIFAR